MVHKKLIEVALPLETINREAACEKSIRHGHPAPCICDGRDEPLAACLAVIFAQMVDDPGSHLTAFALRTSTIRRFDGMSYQEVQGIGFDLSIGATLLRRRRHGCNVTPHF